MTASAAASSASEPIVITGRALVSALGTDVVMACAAARAGISRPSELDHYKGGGSTQVRGGIPLSGHAAAGMTRGFIGNIRLLRMLVAALKALGSNALKTGRAGVFLSYPDQLRTLSGTQAVVDEAERKEHAAQAASTPPSDARGTAAELIDKALEVCEFPALLTLRSVEISGHAGVARAIRDASEALRADRVDTAVVVGVDSLLDTDTLLWLEATARLRTAERAAGLIPGEACAVLVLETARNAAKRASTIFGAVEYIALADEPQNLLNAGASTGLVTAQLIHQALASTQDTTHEPVWILSDHNGESARANEWGNALFHLTRLRAAPFDPLVWFPALSFGDTAAASAAIAVCIATSAWARGYHPARRALISSTSDGSGRAIVSLSMP